ncbi:ImmA/IrrE family metallo-endopeptidase [Vibrio vulnificus]|nr:ImmA/IrrE family metallo-endopeptidase [Vibrio vulnificus]
MTPVEKMAARVLSRHGVKPPYNLNELVEKYADIEEHHFPVDADGVTVGIGGDEKPQILINMSQPPTRKKFTLAHELGHIVIPWHTGTIVSHLNPMGANFEYREMESEANQFAAELLIPRLWLLDLQKTFISVEHFLTKVINDTGASRDAVFIKFCNTIEIPIIFVEIDFNGQIANTYKTKNAPSGANLPKSNNVNDVSFTTSSSEETFNIGGREYRAWVFNDAIVNEETDPRPWREVLTQILDETDSHALLPRINAILPAQYHSNKQKSESEICSLIIRSYDVRGEFDAVVAHPLFAQYVIKRVKELIAKKKT